MDLSNWFGITISVLGLTIAYLQYKIRQQQHKFAIYDKRLPLYIALRRFSGGVFAAGRVKDDDFKQFFNAVSECYLLYGANIRKELDDVLKEARENGLWDATFREYPTGPERTEYIRKASDSFKRLDKLIEQLIKDIEKATALDDSFLVPAIGCSINRNKHK